MIRSIALLAWLAFVVWAVRCDVKARPGVSGAIWIPTLWVGILASRPVSAWFGLTSIRTDLESATAGSPLDMLFYLAMIAGAFFVLSQRHVAWGKIATKNWPVFLFYGYLLVSVLWAHLPLVSFKRWFKEFGNILVALVILTETNHLQACRAVFVRCAYALIPLSVVFLRYFPEWGRTYNVHSGEMQATGVTFQKNSLGAMVLVCGIMVLWDFFELYGKRSQQGGRRWNVDLAIRVVLLLMGANLLRICDSKTSMLCLSLACGVLATAHMPIFRQRIGIIAKLLLSGVILFMLLDHLFGIKEALLQSLGRDMTFTGRTEVWEVLLNLGTDPVFGTGFMSFWDDPSYQSKLPYWVAFSAHNGYMETYIGGGWAGVMMLVVMLLAVGKRIDVALAAGGNYAVVRFTAYAVALIANFSESNFACMTPVGFLFLLAAVEYPYGLYEAQGPSKCPPPRMNHPQKR